MDLLVPLAIAVLVLVGLAATAAGADTRDGFDPQSGSHSAHSGEIHHV